MRDLATGRVPHAEGGYRVNGSTVVPTNTAAPAVGNPGGVRAERLDQNNRVAMIGITVFRYHPMLRPAGASNLPGLHARSTLGCSTPIRFRSFNHKGCLAAQCKKISIAGHQRSGSATLSEVQKNLVVFVPADTRAPFG